MLRGTVHLQAASGCAASREWTASEQADASTHWGYRRSLGARRTHSCPATTASGPAIVATRAPPAPAGRQLCRRSCHPPAAPGKRAACARYNTRQQSRAAADKLSGQPTCKARGVSWGGGAWGGEERSRQLQAGERAAAMPGYAAGSAAHAAGASKPLNISLGAPETALTSGRGPAQRLWHPRSARWARGTALLLLWPALAPAGRGPTLARCGLRHWGAGVQLQGDSQGRRHTTAGLLSA